MKRFAGLLLIATPLCAAPPPQYWPPQWGPPRYAPYPQRFDQPPSQPVAAQPAKPVIEQRPVVVGDEKKIPDAVVKPEKSSKAAVQTKEVSPSRPLTREKQADTTGQQTALGEAEQNQPDGQPAKVAVKHDQKMSVPAFRGGNQQTVPVTQSQPATGDQNVQFQQALQHMQRGDYAKAYCLWTPLAEQGNAEAQFSLGWMYHNGYGLNVDNQQTIKWWQAAADQGLANAAFALGMVYSQGEEAIEEDLRKAVAYYNQAVDGGNEDALPMLADLFANRSREMLDIAKDWGVDEWKRIGFEIRVKVKKANARGGPSTSHQILRSLEEDTRLIQLTRQGSWIRAVVAEEGLLLWVFEPLVEPVDQLSLATEPEELQRHAEK